MRPGPARVYDTLGNSFMIEVRDLFAEDEIFEQRGTPPPGLQRILVIGDRQALIRGQGSP